MSELNQLISRAKAGETECFGQIYNLCRSKGISIAKQYVKIAEDAEDMFQDSFMKAMEHIDSFDESKEFGPWLNTIIVNTCKNYLVKKKPTSFTDVSDDEMEFVDTIESKDEDVIPESVYDRKELTEIMEEIIDTLPQAQKEAVVLFYYKEMSVKQIAEYQDVPEDTIKSRLNYSRKKVSAAVEDYEKKNGIKLHSSVIAPILIALMFKNTAKAAFAENVLSATSATAGSAAATAATSATTSTSTAAVHTAAATAGKATVVKLAAAVAGAAVIIGGGAKVASSLINEPEEVIVQQETKPVQPEDQYEDYEEQAQQEEEVEEVEEEEPLDEIHRMASLASFPFDFYDQIARIGNIEYINDDYMLVTWSTILITVSDDYYYENQDELDKWGEWEHRFMMFKENKYRLHYVEGEPNSHVLRLHNATSIVPVDVKVVDPVQEYHEDQLQRPIDEYYESDRTNTGSKLPNDGVVLVTQKNAEVNYLLDFTNETGIYEIRFEHNPDSVKDLDMDFF